MVCYNLVMLKHIVFIVQMLQLVRVGAFLFLLSSESLLMGVTKCMCLERPLTPGGNRAWYTIYFLSSW
jgi:hypothetical protein